MVGESPIKIAFVGTLSTGKTSIFNALKEHFENDPKIAFVGEVARDFFQKGKFKDRFSSEFQGKIQTEILNREKKAIKKVPRLIVCDRSVIDSVVYLRYYGHKEESQKLLKKVSQWLLSYYMFFLFSPDGWKYSFDRLRTEDEQKRMQIHQFYLDFFAETRLPMEIIDGDFPKRFSKILTFTQSLTF